MSLEYESHEDLVAKLATTLSDVATCNKVIVVRGAVTCKAQSFEDAFRPFVGNAPMECQSLCFYTASIVAYQSTVPGILYKDDRNELEPQDMMFNLEPEQFLQCTKSRAKFAVNWLSGTTEESEWAKVVRR